MYLFIFLLFVFADRNEGLHVKGPSGPVVGQLGGSVLLSCFSESPLPLEDLQVEWRKMDSDSLVSFFQQGESGADFRNPAFRDRADFFPGEVLKGNFSILIRNVVKEDAGNYSCKVKTTRDSSEVEMEVQHIRYLEVRGADQDVFASKGEDVLLNCSVDSAGQIEEVTWKRMDRDPNILVLLYQDTEIFSDSSHPSYQGRVDFFSSEIAKGNFSLKLMDVQMEDKGEFTCEVHTRNMSGRTTVVLQAVGFSVLHIVMLVLCFVTLVLTLGFSLPVLRYKVLSNKGMKRQFFLLFLPNICMFLTFCLWSNEGLVSEVITCSAVSIMRPVLLLKTSPSLSKLSDRLQKVVKALAVPLYHVIVGMASCSIFFNNFAYVQELTGNTVTVMIIVGVMAAFVSLLLAFYDHQIYLTMCLEIFNIEVLGIILSNTTTDMDYILYIPYIILPLLMGTMVTLVIQRHLFRGKTFSYVYIVLPSVGVTFLSFCSIYSYFMHSVILKDFVTAWPLLFEGVLFVLVWIAVIYLLRCFQGRRQGCSSQWKDIGYLCCAVIVALFILGYFTLDFYYLPDIGDDKVRSGYFALMALFNVLAVISLFKHPKYLPGFLHTLIYMFGAVGLSSVNAVVLATELILKAGKGKRTIGDLRVIVLPLEMVFLFAWLSLQIYDSWMRFKERAKLNGTDDRGSRPATEVPEMETLSDPKT